MAKKLSDLTPDPNNYNKHTEFGMSLLEKSMRKFGFAEAGTISEDGVIMSGNARQEVAEMIGLDDVQIIDIDGTRPVYLRRKGIVSGTKEFKELSLALNASAKANIDWNFQAMEADGWGSDELSEWGVNDWNNYSEKNKEVNTDDFEDNCTLVLNFTLEDYGKVKEAIYKIAETPEAAIWQLLKLDERA